MKILYIPLDERPCNYKYPLQLIKNQKTIEIIIPPMNILNQKKKPADIKNLWHFIENEIKHCDIAIFSIEMLIYGGLLPSRIHQSSEQELIKRCEKIGKLKKDNPTVLFYAFNVIMRIPSYDSSDEEPDYYAHYGRKIFEISWLYHKIKQGMALEEEELKYNNLLNEIPKEFYNDYFDRRNKNYKVTSKILDYVKEGIIESMIIPQDDTAIYGIQAIEQGQHIKKIHTLDIENKVFVYPGADEVGCTLLSRVINKFENKIPKVFIRFSSSQGPFIVPTYEDRPYIETIKWHIISSGMQITDNSQNADLILMVNTPGEETNEASIQEQNFRENNTMRNLMEFVTAINMYCDENKKVIVADVAYSNGSDRELIKIMKLENVIQKISGYSGWNTNGNTLGTTLCSGTIALNYGVNKEFLIYRLIEDCGYQSLVRQEINERLSEKDLSYSNFKNQKKWVENITSDSLQKFIDSELKSAFKQNINITNLTFPWERMFEINFSIQL